MLGEMQHPFWRHESHRSSAIPSTSLTEWCLITQINENIVAVVIQQHVVIYVVTSSYHYCRKPQSRNSWSTDRESGFL